MLRTCLIGLCSLCAWTSPLIAAKPSFTPIGDVDPVAISFDGDVVVGNGFQNETSGGFRWSQTDGISALPSPTSDPYARATSVSGDGLTIVGDVRAAKYRWSTSLGDGFLEITQAVDVSYDGVTVVGGHDTFLETLVGDALNAYQNSGVRLYVNEVSADGSTIIGRQDPRGLLPFRWTSERGFDVPGGDVVDLESYVARDVSADGKRVLIGSGIRSGSPITYLWDDDLGMTTINSGEVVLGAMDDAGEILAGAAPLPSGATIWDAENGIQNFKQLLSEEYGLGDEIADWRLDHIVDVSGDGRTFIGRGVSPTGQLSAWVATVPEPSSLAIVCVCVAAFAARRWRRQ